MNNKRSNIRRGLVLLSVALFAALALVQPVSASPVEYESQCEAHVTAYPEPEIGPIDIHIMPQYPFVWVEGLPDAGVGVEHNLDCIGGAAKALR